jgi:hypothetical protein
MSLKDLLIVAHPDDEVLWFRSIISRRETPIIWCFHNSPLEHGEEAEKLYETKLQKVIDFYQNTRTVMWIKTTKSDKTERFGKVSLQTISALSLQLDQIILELRPKIIYTHNPWGEYGHVDHLTVHQALQGQRAICAYPDITLPSASNNRTAEIESKKSLHRLEENPVDQSYVETAIKLYQNNNIWTGREPLNNKSEVFLKWKQPQTS